MRKTVISLIIILFTVFVVSLFAVSCVYDHIFYCPYCSYGSVTDNLDGSYTCTNSDCGKTFGAKEIKQLGVTMNHANIRNNDYYA